MSFVLCDESYLNDLTKLFNKEVRYLEETINYPRWKYDAYPSRRTIAAAIKKKEQYAYIENGKIVGAFVLNDDPGGKYENAHVACKLKEYLVIHTLVTSHECYKRGIASKIVNYCIKRAKEGGYKGVYCDIIPTNTASINLFTKLGFKNLGTFDLERDYLKEMYSGDVPPFVIFELLI